MADLLVSKEGSLFLLTSASKRGQEWIDDNIDKDALISGTSIVIEHRYFDDIICGALTNGLAVESASGGIFKSKELK